MVAGIPKTGKKAANYALIASLIGEERVNPALLSDPASAVWSGLGLYFPVPENIRKQQAGFFSALQFWRKEKYPARVIGKLASIYAFPKWRRWTTAEKLQELERELLSVSGFEFFSPHETVTLELVVEFLCRLCQHVGASVFIPQKEDQWFYSWLHLCGKRPSVHVKILPGKAFSGDILGDIVAEDCLWSRSLLSPDKQKSAFPPADMCKEFERLIWEGREKTLVWQTGPPINFNNTIVARTQQCPSLPGAYIFQTKSREWEVVHAPSAQLLHAGKAFSSRDKAINFLWLYLSLLGHDFLARPTGQPTSYNRIERERAYWVGDVLRAAVF